jgi:hypothetical protein
MKAARAAHAAYEAAVAQHKPQDEIDDLMRAAVEPDLKLEDDEVYLQTEYLTFLARKYLILFPKRTDSSKWTKLDDDYRWYLKIDGIRELQAEIRTYREKRMEKWRLWISTIIPSLTGLLGVIVALLAIIWAHR